MPMMQTDNGADIHYQIDDFRDPWLPEPELAGVERGSNLKRQEILSSSLRILSQSRVQNVSTSCRCSG